VRRGNNSLEAATGKSIEATLTRGRAVDDTHRYLDFSSRCNAVHKLGTGLNALSFWQTKCEFQT
jgi:hypothetical protein